MAEQGVGDRDGMNPAAVLPVTQEFSSVSVILPAMDETYSMRETVDIIAKTCDRRDLCEFFIVLCDRSTKECVETAQSIATDGYDVPVKIYFQQRPFVGAAIQEAFERIEGSHVIMMSTDLETDPHLVNQMITGAKRNPNGIVTASRWIAGGGFTGYSRLKWALNFIFQKAMGVLFLTGHTDLTYAYRVFPTKLVRAIRWEEQKHPFFLETALKPLRLGIQMTEIPAKWQARTEGRSQNTFLQNFIYFRTELRIRFMKKKAILRRE